MFEMRLRQFFIFSVYGERGGNCWMPFSFSSSKESLTSNILIFNTDAQKVTEELLTVPLGYERLRIRLHCKIAKQGPSEQ